MTKRPIDRDANLFTIALVALAGLLVGIVATGCIKSKVGRQPRTEAAEMYAMKQGLPGIDDWYYAHRPDGVYVAVMLERDGDELILHCEQTRGPRWDLDHHLGPYDKNPIFVECDQNTKAMVRRYLLHPGEV